MSTFATYRRVYSEEEATELLELLTHENIPYQIEGNRDILDKIYVGDSMDPMISINIPEDEFEHVNELLKTSAQTQLHTLNPDYYLFHFSNQELLDVTQNPNEWNAFDQGIAAKLLSDRKVDVEHITEGNPPVSAYTPIRVRRSYIILQYLLSIVLLYAGLIIGLATLCAYRTLSNGQRVKMYDDETREHGKFMIVIGVIWLLIMLYLFYSR